MLELTPEERTLCYTAQKPEVFIYRQAEIFSLVINGYEVCTIDTEVCKSLINKYILVEVGQDETKDETKWLYRIDPVIFGPAFEIEEKQC